jgi:hypothetical protein
MFCKNLSIAKTFYLLFSKVHGLFQLFIFSIDFSQIIKCKMNKQVHIELFNIEAFVVIEGVCEIFEPLGMLGF